MQKCKYIEKEKKVIRYVTDDLEFYSDDSDKGDFDKETLKGITLTTMSFLREQFICSYF